jgi:hypothetical protein
MDPDGLFLEGCLWITVSTHRRFFVDLKVYGTASTIPETYPALVGLPFRFMGLHFPILGLRFPFVGLVFHRDR